MSNSCVSCGKSLPEGGLGVVESTGERVCPDCQSAYQEALGEECPPEVRARVQPTAFRFDEGSIAPPTERLVETTRELGALETKNDSRIHPRRVINVPILTLPLNDKMQPTDQAFVTISCNISKSGICLMSDRKITEPYVAVQLPKVGNQKIQVAMEILRRREVAGLQEIGGKFVARVER